ncbi:hypothetical protein FPSE5266_04719 [Fusarium pseudograminearum]|nr:hypothetical protein FPSE5266_04719 [Fusarium pseudograminearum]
MATTMLYTTGASVEDPPHSLTNTTNGSGKPRHRPTALQIKPLDPSELSAKLGGLSVESNDQLSPSIHIENSTRPPLSAMSMGVSPRTIPETRLSPSAKTTVSSASCKRDSDRLNLPSPGKPPRRGSIFDAFRFKGSNYTDEAQSQDTGNAQKPAPYKHVPQVAAQQFARTTTVETLSQKTSPKGMRPAPGPRSMSNATISLQEYHRQYKRAQSICTGRTSSGYNQSKLAGTVDANDRISQQKKQNARLSSYGNRPELPRRMSTGNMSGKNDPQPPSPFRQDSTGIGGFQGNNAPSTRRDSASSSGFSDTSSSFTRDSGPATPFKSEFGGNISPNRRGSETSAATSGSRRGSFVNVPNPQHTAEIHRVDWSQSNQSAKVQRDSKWGGLKHRKTSVSQQKPKDEKDGPHVIETALQTTNSQKSPKPGFLKRFMH